jgi:hypothetical protein
MLTAKSSSCWGCFCPDASRPKFRKTHHGPRKPGEIGGVGIADRHQSLRRGISRLLPPVLPCRLFAELRPSNILPFYFIGGPGRTRTCNQAVMSQWRSGHLGKSAGSSYRQDARIIAYNCARRNLWSTGGNTEQQRFCCPDDAIPTARQPDDSSVLR